MKVIDGSDGDTGNRRSLGGVFKGEDSLKSVFKTSEASIYLSP